MGLQYVRGVRLSLKRHPEFNERWLREVILSDPMVLGLGPMTVAAVERLQQGGGRVDLLLQQEDRRYVVELMLGAVDESHIVRAIQYWDCERRAHPEFEHRVVLIAEELGGRFANVLRLLNKAVPLIGLQLTALRLGELVTVSFTRLLDTPAASRPRGRRARSLARTYTEASGGPTEAQQLFSTFFPENSLPPRR